MTSVETITAVASKKGLEKVIEDIYEASKGQLRMRLKRWKARKNISILYTKIKNIRKVKTILQPEKAVDLLKFYYASKVRVRGERKVIRDIDDLCLDGNIVIRGTVGQGKSIFFRYLASREMVKGKRVPLFVELRRIQKNEKLLNHMVEEADALGLRGMDKDTFLWLAEEGKIVLLLDAFDEVLESERTRITNEIERLAKKYEHMNILVSSRPNSGIENSPFFRVFDLTQLKGQEYEEAIGAMAEEDVSGKIIKTIKSSRSPVGELLTTPLMVALLIVRHRIEQMVPDNIIGFYQGLFGLLISRHDKMKGGYIRPRQSGLGDAALEDVFNGICFLTRKEGEGTFVRREITRYAKESARLTDHKADPDAVIEDIIKITCLLLEEGDECRFIHKSVQEYYAACFIKEQTDAMARKFYGYVVNNWGDWAGELQFLSIIDKYRFVKWFLVPDMRRTLRLKAKDAIERSKTTREHVRSLFKSTEFRVRGTKEGWSGFDYGPLPYTIQVWCGLYNLDKVLRSDWYRVLKAIEQTGKGPRIKAKRAVTWYGPSYAVSGEALFDSGLLEKEMVAVAEDVFRKVRKGLTKAEKYIRDVERRQRVFEF